MIQIESKAKIYLSFFLFFIFSGLHAQTRYQQITLGGGVGAATAYAGATIPQTNAALYADACYYPFPVFNIELEGQAGTLSGASPDNGADLKNFTNSYKAVLFDANVYLGAFFDPQKNGFLNIIKNFYGGVGYGVIVNNVNNIDLSNPSEIDQVSNKLQMIQFKSGFEYNILKNRYNEPVLKIDLSSRFNYVIGRGLDGYYTTYSRSFALYNFYAVGLKYTIIIRAAYGHSYNKFD